MEDIEIKRLDHLGIVSGVIKELGIIEMIDERLKKEEQDQEKITAGEAVAGMILNGLGFSDMPLSLTPHFFETKPVESLFREGVLAEHFNRYKLGKTLDRAHEYGCEKLFYELAASAHRQEKIDEQFMSEDTTSFSLTGEYHEDTDENAILITQGYSKDLRPDLKQVVQELLVSQDGGVPLMMKCWDGNASDNTIFKERSKKLISLFNKTEAPNYLIADSKLYHEGNAENLKQLNFITRIPSTLKEEQKSISEAIKANEWIQIDAENKYFTNHILHYGMTQRWMIIYSNQAKARAIKTLGRALEKEGEALKKKLKQIKNQPYDCMYDAERAADAIVKKAHYHRISKKTMTEKKVYEGLGRPKKESTPIAVQYFIEADIECIQENIEAELEQRSCYVIGTNADSALISEIEVIYAYKRQNSSIENMGFRFMKDPIFFTSSFFIKKPSRIMGLVTIMTLSLLVYAIAQRRLRAALAGKNETIPNQIKKPITNPTMRWTFQLLMGIHILKRQVNGIITMTVHGLSELKEKIIRLMGPTICAIYGLNENSQFSGRG